MFVNFFMELRAAKVPVSLREYLTLLEAVDKNLADYSMENFYYLSRACMVKDERNLDKFDQVFGHAFKGVEKLTEVFGEEIPEEWLQKLAEKHLTKEEMEKIKSLGGFEELMKTLAERLAEQEQRHQGGSKWIGTAGTSPFGAYGYNPEGIRIGQDSSRHRRAVKVWDKRDFKNLDDSVELGTRNMKIALRRLRKFARIGAETELDLDSTINATAKQGWLDVKMRPERHNKIKVLIFFDVGGSMDDHVKVCEELFSAVKSEFKHLEFFYFHNCLYEGVWKDNYRRWDEGISTYDIIHTYPKDYKLIFVGDASMSPYEILYPGGAVEYWNVESGATWMQRMLDHYQHAVWINPISEHWWGDAESIDMIGRIMTGRMYSLTIDGLDQAMRELNR